MRLIHTPLRAYGAIVLGTICLIGLLVTLFWHVRSWSDLTPMHVFVLIAVIGALGSEYLIHAAIGDGEYHDAFWFVLVFLACTFVCVALSAGRGAETLANRKTAVLQADGARLNHERQIAEARVERDTLRAAADKAQALADTRAQEAASECQSGRRVRCEGSTFASEKAASASLEARKRHEGADARYWQLVAQLDGFKMLPPANLELKNIARLWAILTSYDALRSEEGLELLWPLLLALITEIGTCRFLSYGMRKLRRPANVPPSQTDFANVLPNSLEKQFPEAKPIRTDFGANGCRNPLATRRDDAEVDLVAFIRINGFVPKQEFLRERWGIRSRGTISTWLKEWEELGLISRQADGRVKIVKGPQP